MEAEIATTKQYFSQSNNILLSDEWLEGLLNWFKEENQGTNYTLQELHTQVYEQWLLLDFRDIELPVLPRDITKQKKLVLNQSICLQLMSVVDISKSKFSQIHKIRNSNMQTGNADENVSGKRVLQLTLTDGVQEILATEYKPISFLNLNLTPGIKVRLLAPITVRRGQIFLEPASIKILGGEVEELLVENAAENILAKALNLPINANPVVVQETFDRADMEVINRGNQVFDNYRTAPATTNTQIKKQLTAEELEEIRIAEEMDLLETKYTKSEKLTRPSTPDLFDDFNNEEFAKIEMKTTNEPQTTIMPKPASQPALPLSTFDDFIDMDELEELMKLPSPTENVLGKKSVTPIEKLLKLHGKVNKGKFTINAKFKSVVQKLSINPTSFSIRIAVEDSTGEINVALHSDLVADLLGYDIDVMIGMKNGTVAKNPSIISTVYQAINSFKEKLLLLNGKMEVLLEAKEEVPVVLKLLQ